MKLLDACKEESNYWKTLTYSHDSKLRCETMYNSGILNATSTNHNLIPSVLIRVPYVPVSARVLRMIPAVDVSVM